MCILRSIYFTGQMLAMHSTTYWLTEVCLPLFFFFPKAVYSFVEANFGKLAYQLKYLNYKTLLETLMRVF